MRFAVLGPLRAYVGDHEVAITAPRERVALAMLVLRVGETVPVTHLVDAIWPDAPPPTARNQVQLCVSRLRRQLTSAGASHAVIVTEPSGYRLQVDRRYVDLHEFRTLVTSARAAAAEGKPKDARDRYRTALGLWKGLAFVGLESTELSGVANALEEERIQALAECLDIELQCGADGSLVAELTELVRQHPYREGLRATLMRALYRAGRPAEALEEYHKVRMLLREDLGTEPSEELRRLHKAILNRDPSIDPPPPAPTGLAPTVRDLPAEPSRFVGRSREIAEVRAALVSASRDARRPTVVVVYGPGGVGKSALAVRTSHELASVFPDGQLYVDLCGSTPGIRPLTPVEVLGRFLRRLGVPPEQIPTEPAEAAALFRSATTDARLLLVLDNAAGTEQVAPLVPASPTCGVLVTSRHPLASLDVDHRLRLGVLADADGLALLIGLSSRLASEPHAAEEILALTDCLPLAIRIAAGRLACRPDLSVAEYAQRLADRSRRLDELQLEDLAVRASIRTSYDALLSGSDPATALAARAFRILGLLHVPDVAPGVVAAMLAEPDIHIARAALDRLVDAQLLEPFGNCRYRLHDLVRLVAAERATEEDSSTERDGAIYRAVAFYTGTLWEAFRLQQPARATPFGDPPIARDVHIPSFGEPVSANTWVDDEMHNLLAAFEQATGTVGDTFDLVVWFGQALWSSLDARFEWRAAHGMSGRLAQTAEQKRDKRSMACGFLLHGRSEACVGRYGSAKSQLEQALALLWDLDNHCGVVLALNGMGIVDSRRGESAEALSWYAEALRVAEKTRLSDLMAVVLGNMAVAHACLGDLKSAVKAVEQCASICAAINAPDTLGMAMNNMAAIHCLLGDFAAALQCADEAYVLANQTGQGPSKCEAIVIRSEVNRRRGGLSAAIADADRVLSLAKAGGHRFMVAAALRQRGKILADMDRPVEAAKAEQLARDAYAELVHSYRDPMTELIVGQDGVMYSDAAANAGD